MSVLKIRGEDGVVREVLALKGEKGDPGSGGGGDASQITYNGEGQYISASNVEAALHEAGRYILDLTMDKADEWHKHDASGVNYENKAYGITDVYGALDYLFDQVGDVSAVFDELHAYAQSIVNGGGVQ